MDESINKDKVKIEEILNEIENLKKYNNELASSVRGEKLESYVDSLSKNIRLFQNKIEETYGSNYNNIDNQ